MKTFFSVLTGLVCLVGTSYAVGSPGVSMFIWSDKYAYKPGETMTIKGTFRPNGDTTGYTAVAFRQNNQTGKRFYYPANSETPTDIFGKTVEQGFDAVPVQAAEKATLASGITIPEEYGMHTLVFQIRDEAGGRVLKSAYQKIAVVRGEETVQGNIEASRTFKNDTLYRLKGIVIVRNNATLTIEPGTIIYGEPGSQPPSVLVVGRNGKINAQGTRQRPIIMTSAQPFGERQRGDWGGIIMLGRAPINVGANAVAGASNTAGEFAIEGLPASDDTRYGGTDSEHDCGALSYVRVEYAGSILSPNNETNAFTWGGCGKKTVAHHLQAVFGLDDSFEWFGGNNDAKYLVGGHGADDYVDFQLGYTGRIQFGLFYQNSDGRGNRGIEGDNSEYNQAATPRSNPTMYNLTFVGSASPGFDEASSPGIFLRRGSAGTFNNMIVTNFYSSGLELNDANTQAQADEKALTMNGILLWANGTGTQAANTVTAQTSTNTVPYATGQRGEFKSVAAADPLLFRPFDWSDPDFRPLPGSAAFGVRWIVPPDDGFFDSVDFIGGIGDENWIEEWTSFIQDSDMK
jgi:hypothetical protein